MFTRLQVNWEDDTQCHQHGLLQLPRICWEQRWFPENCGRHSAAVWCWGLQHKAGNRWVCGQCAVVQMYREKLSGTRPLKLVSTRALILSWVKNVHLMIQVKRTYGGVSFTSSIFKFLTCTCIKSLWQTLMTLNRLSIKLEIKLHLPHHICHHLLSFSWIILPVCLIIFQWLQCYMNYSTFVELCTVWA